MTPERNRTQRAHASRWAARCLVPIAALALSSSGIVGGAAPQVQAAHSAATCVPPPAGLVSWWPGDGNARDIRGGNNGTVFPGTRYGRGIVGRAFRFTGTGRGIFLRDRPNLMLTHAFTIEAWVRGTYVSGPHAQIFFRGDTRLYLDPYSLRIIPNGQIELHVESTTTIANLDAPFPRWKWTYVAATFSDETGTMSLYLNGSLAKSMHTVIRPFGALDRTQNPGLAIGGIQDNVDQPEPFRGRIDELSVYNRALPAATIRAIYNAGSAGKCRK